jgi:putative DNA methylase
VNERRLIEKYLPVAAVSYEATREKLLRRRDYHISTLHIWWARRPLAAARAAVYAALIRAPEEVDADGLATFFKSLCAWGGPSSAIAEARKQILAANDGEPPKVLDMFAGGGAIPLEATRLGCETTALELNPVAHLIELCTLSYPQRFGPSLADDVHQWGRRFIDRAKEEIGDLYPELVDDGNGQTTIEGPTEGSRRVPIAYLWTRTVPCPNPAEKPHTVPLVRQTWLVKKTERFVALKIVPDRPTMTLSYEVVGAASEGELGFDPAGHSKRGSTTCPLCGASIPLDYVKEQGRAGRLGVELMAVGLLPRSGRGKSYIGSREAATLLPDEERVARSLADLADQGFAPPDELICSQDNQAFLTPKYGLTLFRHLFQDRQLVMLLTLCKLTHEIHAEILREGIADARAKAITTYLGLLIDRMADYHSTLTHWVSTFEKTNSTYARQALPMSWDFSEANPFGGSSGDLCMHLNGIVKVVEHCAAAGKPVRVVRGSAMELPFQEGSFDAVITDPPYYDNVPYADASDFFYIWLKRSVGLLHQEHLSAELTPKRSEIVASRYRNDGSRDDARAAYVRMMADAFSEARRVLKPDGILVCVYAHQTTAGWATLIEAVRHAGFVVVEAWPLDTEMPVRGRAQGSAALASSIFLVARPRVEQETGDWAHEVRPELERIITERVGALPQLGITGTDLVIAAIGAGMRAYTRYARVEKPNGEELAAEEYLEEVEREVAEAALERIFGTDRSGLGRVDQETQFYVMGRFEFGEAFAPWDELNTLARGTGIELHDLANGTGSLIAFGAKRNEAKLSDYRERGGSIVLGRSTIDHLQRVLWLADNEPTKIRDYLDAARPDPERLRLVAHALSRPGLDSAAGRSEEAGACERLLGVWKRLVEDNLFTQGRM